MDMKKECMVLRVESQREADLNEGENKTAK